ncbi:MAG: COX15/CtaA family protein [Planctomycetota bacterium]
MNAQTSNPLRGSLLTIVFGATLAMWVVIYLTAMPLGLLPLWLAVTWCAACLFAAGYICGRFASGTVVTGTLVGLAITNLSLLILLSLLGGDRPEDGLWPAARWILGFLVVAVALGAGGAALGRRFAPDTVPRANWTARFAMVTALVTLAMVVAGGVVTGLEAGLAIEGWLRPEGHLLVLFPVSLMQRDIPTFVEHAHRLWGLLVGISTIMLLVHVWQVDNRRWLHGLTGGVVLAVIAQGVLGGTRVTEESLALAIAHGVFAHLIFATLVVVAAVTSSPWLSNREPTTQPSVKTDRTLSLALVVLIVVQIIAGTLVRHLQSAPGIGGPSLSGLLHGHSFIGSTAVVVLVLFCGVRTWGMYAGQPVIRRAGVALIRIMILQVLLGIASFMVVPKGPHDPDAAIPGLEVAFTTVHHAVGAILLAAAATLFVWQRRLLRVP